MDKVSIKADSDSIGITFISFVFISEHSSGSETNLFSVFYELSENGEKLYFDNPLGDPCETSEGEAINTFIDTLAKIFRLCEERG